MRAHKSSAALLVLAAVVLAALAVAAPASATIYDFFKDEGKAFASSVSDGNLCVERTFAGVNMKRVNTVLTNLQSRKGGQGKPPSLTSSLPTLAGAHGYCVTVGDTVPGVKKALKRKRAVYYSLYNPATHTPAAVFFRMPVPNPVASKRNGEWPSSQVENAPEVWDVYSPTKQGTYFKEQPLGSTKFVRATVAPDEQVSTHGHMIAATYFDGDPLFIKATFTFANCFPSYNNPNGAGRKQPGWDGEIWNARELALAAYAKAAQVPAEALFVVIGTSQTDSNLYLALPNLQTKCRKFVTTQCLVAVPKYAWTAVYDSVHGTGLAWKCEIRTNNVNVETPSCQYVSINMITKEFKIDPFPGAPEEARANNIPSRFEAPAREKFPSDFGAVDWKVTEKVVESNQVVLENVKKFMKVAEGEKQEDYFFA